MEERGRWERFRRMVMAAPELRRELLEPLEEKQCVAAMLAISGRCGLALTQADVEAAKQGYRFVPEAPTAFNAAEEADVLTGWIPAAVVVADGRPLIDWVDLGDRRLTEPFFENSIAQVRYRPFYRWFALRTSFETLQALVEREPGVPPTGFLFHLSRCGSTLVSQMLAAVERHIVLSEPEPIDCVLRARETLPGLTETEQMRWLKAMLSALGRRRTSDADRLFVKFDCWHTPLLPHIRRAFPDVPWAFLYRDPVEVLVSHKREPGRHMADPAEFAELFEIEDGPLLPAEAYGERVLTAICEAALEGNRQDSGLFLNYTALPEAVYTTLAAHFRIRFSPVEIERMRAVIGVHAKRPYMPFDPDSAAKQASGQAGVSAACRERLLGVYRACEAAASAGREQEDR